MAPSFDHLPDPEEEDYDEDEELDFSDLREKYDVQIQQGLDTFVCVDGLPKVTEETKPKLIKFLLRKLNTVGKTKEDLIFMPVGESGQTDGYAQKPIYRTWQWLIRVDLHSLNILPPPKPQQRSNLSMA
jgi:translation initiation factor 3 subunit B